MPAPAPIPRVAIVGRPNVGKSSLLNLLAGRRVSIVDPTPGTTRDRVSALVSLAHPDDAAPPRTVEFIDTGGFGVYVAAGRRFDNARQDLSRLTPHIEQQIARAIHSADLILFAVDAQAGVTPHDLEIARLLREGRLALPASPGSPRRPPPPVRVVATKTDGPKWEAHALELASLGFGRPLPCSAKSGFLRRALLDELYAIIPPPHPSPHQPRDTTPADTPPSDTTELLLAIIGKRNAGKSTLVNTLAGEPRVIVSEIAGTTRDAVDVRFQLDARSLVAIDTAGLRRKKSFQDRIEWYAFDRAKAAVDRCHVALLLIDATEKLSQVDEHLAMLVQKSFKPVIIVVNKWDRVAGTTDPDGVPITPERFEAYLRAELRGLDFAPIAFISASTGLNVRDTVLLAFELLDQARRRVPTGPLNRLIQRLVERRGPSSKLGSFAKVYYAAQVAVCPPTIALVVNKPELFRPNYQRFLLNRFREELPFAEVPIKLLIRARSPREKPADTALAAARDAAPAPPTTPAAPAAADSFFEDD